MKNQLIPIWIVLFLMPSFCEGQLSVSIEPENFLFSGKPSETDIVFDVDVINTSDEVINLLWSKRLNNGPAQWLTWICTDSLCYTPDVISCPPGSPKVIAPGDTTVIHMHLNPRNIEGTGEYVVNMVDVDGTVLGAIVGNVLISLISATSHADKEKSISVFPNPAFDYFKTSNIPGLKSIELFTILGTKIKSMDAAPNKHYSVADLKDGLYLVRLLGPSGTVLKTIRLSVK